MMKNSVLLMALLTGLSIVTTAQNKYFTRSGVIKFVSDTPMETLESSNKEVNIILDPSNGNMACKVQMKSFNFEKQAMKDHFNDKYLETDQYPEATFQGKITTPVNLTQPGTYDVTVDGTLTIHGVAKKIQQKGKVTVESGKISVKSQFKIVLADYKVKIGADYVKKIAPEVQVSVSGTLTPYER